MCGRTHACAEHYHWHAGRETTSHWHAYFAQAVNSSVDENSVMVLDLKAVMGHVVEYMQRKLEEKRSRRCRNQTKRTTYLPASHREGQL
jgi:hypothetical protein